MSDHATRTQWETSTPHGGELVDLRVSGAEEERTAEEAEHLPKVELGPREAADLEMLATGGLSPLRGFMVEKDYRPVVEEMRLSSGLAWSIPITLSLDDDGLKRIGGADAVGLTLGGAPVAVLDVEQAKGLEFDGVLLLEPAEVLEGSPRGANDLYVAMTRPTQRLRVLHERPLPEGF